MSKLKIGNEWWTSPTESENGNLVMVTGRIGVEPFIEKQCYDNRVEITWDYAADSQGMPDIPTSKLMGEATDRLLDAFAKDAVAVMTGIYTGDGQRNWVFYTRDLQRFQGAINEALKDMEMLPIHFYAEHDPEWNEYREMKEQSEILGLD